MSIIMLKNAWKGIEDFPKKFLKMSGKVQTTRKKCRGHIRKSNYEKYRNKDENTKFLKIFESLKL